VQIYRALWWRCSGLFCGYTGLFWGYTRLFFKNIPGSFAEMERGLLRMSRLCRFTCLFYKRPLRNQGPFSKETLQSQHTATYGNTLQHTATHCNTLPYTATHCSTLQHTAAHFNTLCSTLQHTAAHCNILQHTATHCITLQHTVIHHKALPIEVSFIRRPDNAGRLLKIATP